MRRELGEQRGSLARGRVGQRIEGFDQPAARVVEAPEQVLDRRAEPLELGTGLRGALGQGRERVEQRLVARLEQARGGERGRTRPEQLEPPAGWGVRRKQAQRGGEAIGGERRGVRGELVRAGREQRDRVLVARLRRLLDVPRDLRRGRGALLQRAGEPGVRGDPPARPRGLVDGAPDDRMAEPQRPGVAAAGEAGRDEAFGERRGRGARKVGGDGGELDVEPVADERTAVRERAQRAGRAQRPRGRWPARAWQAARRLRRRRSPPAPRRRTGCRPTARRRRRGARAASRAGAGPRPRRAREGRARSPRRSPGRRALRRASPARRPGGGPARAAGAAAARGAAARPAARRRRRRSSGRRRGSGRAPAPPRGGPGAARRRRGRGSAPPARPGAPAGAPNAGKTAASRAIAVSPELGAQRALVESRDVVVERVHEQRVGEVALELVGAAHRARGRRGRGRGRPARRAAATCRCRARR